MKIEIFLCFNQKKCTQKSFALVMLLMISSLLIVSSLAFLTFSLNIKSRLKLSGIQVESDTLSRSVVEELIYNLSQEIYSDSTNGSIEFHNKKMNPVYSYSSINSKLNYLRGSGVKTVASSGFKKGIPEAFWRKTGIQGVESLSPEWVYMTRTGIITNSGFSEKNIKELSDVKAENAVVGRFAGVIYETTSFIDINNLSFPRSIKEEEISSKGFLDYIQWDKVGILSGNDFQKIADWRFQIFQDDQDQRDINYYSSFDKIMNQEIIPNGNLVVPVGVNQFLNRKDFLENRFRLLSTLNNGFNFTHFSRGYSSPSYQPEKMSGGGFSSATINRPLNQFLIKKGFIRWDGSLAQIGEPLVKNRFPLDRLRWVTNKGMASGADEELFLKLFGMEWDSINHIWRYVSDKSGSIQSRILNISEISTLNREPNFFELLKATILDGSLGLDAGQTIADTVSIDSNADFQIVRIGLNIIDQFDLDSYPTLLRFGDYEFSGQENIPYYSKTPFWVKGDNSHWGAPAIIPAYRYKNGADDRGGMPPYYVMMGHEMWNPYQQTSRRKLQYPSKIRIKPIVDSTSRFLIAYEHQLIPYGLSMTGDQGNYNQNPIEISLNSTKYINPTIVSGESGPKIIDNTSALQGYLAQANGESFKTLSTHFFGDPITYHYVGGTPSNIILSVEYLSEQGNWKQYTTFSGMSSYNRISNLSSGFKGSVKTPMYFEDLSGQIKYQPINQPGNFSGIQPLPNAFNQGYVKLDPRTFRFGVSMVGRRSYNPLFHGYTMRPELDQQTEAWETTYTKAGGWGVAYYSTPWAQSSKIFGVAANNFISYMTENRYPQSGIQGFYKDRDGIQRWGDSALDSGASSGNYKINPMSMVTSTNRPIVLDRAIKTVGELGYVYRDMPWKSLDFFTTNSADAGLLETFSAPLRPSVYSGSVNFNFLNQAQIKAIILGAYRSPSLQQLSTLDRITESEAEVIATDLYSLMKRAPFESKMDLVTRLSSDQIKVGWPENKQRREAIVRALSEVVDFRVRTFLIDIVYQKGLLKKDAKSWADFNDQSQDRFWAHVSIDIVTGKVIDCQIEKCSTF